MLSLALKYFKMSEYIVLKVIKVTNIYIKYTCSCNFSTLANSNKQGYEGSYVEYGCGVGFETFGCSLLIVFQIVTTNDWHEIMLGAILDSGEGPERLN